MILTFLLFRFKWLSGFENNLTFFFIIICWYFSLYWQTVEKARGGGATCKSPSPKSNQEQIWCLNQLSTGTPHNYTDTMEYLMNILPQHW